MSSNNMKKGACRLCEKVAELQESHIIPSFVWKWLKDSSGSGYLRFGQQPNKRSQDGYKSRLLCKDCEQRFNKWETQFSNNIFHPMNQGEVVTIKYGSWFLPFCVSVSWRVLNFYLELGDDLGLPKKFRESVNHTQTVWKEVLLGQRPHPERHEQHFLPLDVIENLTSPDMPQNINRYILRSVDIDIIHDEKGAFIYSKLGHFVILGFIEESNPRRWKGTIVHVHNSVIKPLKFNIHSQFGKYLQKKAHRMAESQSQISEKQNKKIEEAIFNDPSRVANSESFRAMISDVSLFGDAAFRKKE